MMRDYKDKAQQATCVLKMLKKAVYKKDYISSESESDSAESEHTNASLQNMQLEKENMPTSPTTQKTPNTNQSLPIRGQGFGKRRREGSENFETPLKVSNKPPTFGEVQAVNYKYGIDGWTLKEEKGSGRHFFYSKNRNEISWHLPQEIDIKENLKNDLLKSDDFQLQIKNEFHLIIDEHDEDKRMALVPSTCDKLGSLLEELADRVDENEDKELLVAMNGCLKLMSKNNQKIEQEAFDF